MSNSKDVGSLRKSEVWQNFTCFKTMEKAKSKLCQATTFKMNSNVHYQGGLLSLGLIRIQGSMNATKAIRLIKEQLQLICLELNKDVVCAVYIKKHSTSRMKVSFG